MGYRDPRGRRSAVRPDLELWRVAEDTGISAGYLGEILKGNKTPSLHVAESLARALELSGIDELRAELSKYKPIKGRNKHVKKQRYHR